MKKPKPFEYERELREANFRAQTERPRQSVEQAKEAFREHWHRAAEALFTILRDGDSDTARAALLSVEDTLSRAIEIRKNPEAGRFVLSAGQAMASAVVAMAQEQPPPPWLVEEAANEYEVPWLMVNGKPAPGFAECDAALAWGRKAIRRGKSRFDAPQTRAVADALHHIHYLRAHPDFAELFVAITGDDMLRFLPDMRRYYKRFAALPPLSRKTRGQWWPEVRKHVRGNTRLPKNETGRIIFKKDTPAARRAAFLKDCKKAFYALCPADAPGDKSPDSSPRPVRCDKSTAARTCSRNKIRKGAKKNERAGTRSTEKPVAGRGGNARRSPRNHGGRKRGEGRTR